MPPHPRLDNAVLTEIAAGVARAQAWWRQHAHHDPGGRRPVRLLATDAYEVWVIGWTAGQGVELHDHGDSAGVLLVVEGELAELTLVADGTLRRTGIRAGSVKELPVGTVHDIVAATMTDTTSIHVYSPPLTTMRRRDPVTLEPGDVEAIEVESPVAVPSHPSFFGSSVPLRGTELPKNA